MRLLLGDGGGEEQQEAGVPEELPVQKEEEPAGADQEVPGPGEAAGLVQAPVCPSAQTARVGEAVEAWAGLALPEEAVEVRLPRRRELLLPQRP